MSSNEKYYGGSPFTTAEDFEHILTLLREYTEKLRSVCEEYSAYRYRRFQTLGIMVTVITLLASFMFIFIEGGFLGISESGFSYSMLQMGAVMLTASMVGLIIFTQFSVLPFSYSKARYDAEQVQRTVKVLIDSISQYRDHAKKRISNKFEFDLRIAEAETALKFYESIFERNRGL